MKADTASEAIDFLQALRAPPWVLTAINSCPSGKTPEITTITARNAGEALAFVRRWGAERNLYYSTNPTRTARNKKAAKTDIAAIEFALADLDPADNETPEAAKARYLVALETFKPTPTAVVDSGNGIQLLWRLKEPIKLADPVVAKDKVVYDEATLAIIDDVEARIADIMVRLGSVAGTQNIDRILRLPGTTNYPNPAKKAKGRVPCPTKQIRFDDSQFDLADFPKPEAKANNKASNVSSKSAPGTDKLDWTKVEQHDGWLRSADDLPANFSEKGKIIVAHVGNLSDLNVDLDHSGKKYGSWSDVSMALAAYFKASKFEPEKIAAALMCNLPCNAHVNHKKTDQERRRAVERALLRSYDPVAAVRSSSIRWREKWANGMPRSTMHNARVAIAALGIQCRYDTFHHKLLVGFRDDGVRHEVQSLAGEVTDDGIIMLRQLMSDRFGVDFHKNPTIDAVISLAHQHRFDPVLDMLAKAEAEWDGKPRLDRMAVDYFNSDDTEFNTAALRITMIAAVRRARHPGCKFDEITVTESPEGFGKSGAWRMLAGDDNFSDQSILGKNGREVQEQLSSIWIHENAELAGLGKTEIESVKAFASRQEDIARPAYGRFVYKQPRHSIEVGTTNDDEYLQSQTGNRRFWTLKIRRAIDLDKLRRDRLQLWGEAAKREALGESIRLDEKLWAVASIEQENRRVKDGWEDILANIPARVSLPSFKGNGERDTYQVVHLSAEQEKVRSADILTYVLGIPVERHSSTYAMRVARVMKRHGWQRTSNGKVSISGEQVRGYFRQRDGVLPLSQSP